MWQVWKQFLPPTSDWDDSRRLCSDPWWRRTMSWDSSVLYSWNITIKHTQFTKWRFCYRLLESFLRDVLSSDLDELLEQLHSFSQRRTEKNLRHHPLLNFITALKKKLQRHRVATARLTTERVEDQLLLWRERERKRKWCHTRGREGL